MARGRRGSGTASWATVATPTSAGGVSDGEPRSTPAHLRTDRRATRLVWVRVAVSRQTGLSSVTVVRRDTLTHQLVRVTVGAGMVPKRVLARFGRGERTRRVRARRGGCPTRAERLGRKHQNAESQDQELPDHLV